MDEFSLKTARDDVKSTGKGGSFCGNLSGQIDLVVSLICHCLFLRSQGWCLGYTMDYADVDFKASVWNEGCPEGIGVLRLMTANQPANRILNRYLAEEQNRIG